MSDIPQYPSGPDPQQPPGTVPPPPPAAPPAYGGYGTPPPPVPPLAPPPGYGTGGYPRPPAYDVMQAVGYAWRKFVAHLGVFLVLGIILMVVSFGSGVGDVFFGTGGILVTEGVIEDGALPLAVTLIANLVNVVVSVVVSLALLRGALDVTAGVPVTLGSVFTRWRFWHVIGAGLLMLLISIPGFILCIVPGFVVIFLLWYAQYFAMDGMSPTQAIGASYRMVKANVGGNLLLLLMVVLGSVLAVCTCGIGMVVVQPLAVIATAYTYRFFTGQSIAP